MGGGRVEEVGQNTKRAACCYVRRENKEMQSFTFILQEEDRRERFQSQLLHCY